MGMSIEQAKKLDHFLCSDCSSADDANRSPNGYPVSSVSGPKHMCPSLTRMISLDLSSPTRSCSCSSRTLYNSSPTFSRISVASCAQTPSYATYLSLSLVSCPFMYKLIYKGDTSQAKQLVSVLSQGMSKEEAIRRVYEQKGLRRTCVEESEQEVDMGRRLYS
ncbi:hypothetical protein MA16_Dca027355 [Dendrobium catenatum]|uniref:Uncharacterized protein n=1 Tax=Dendrobium catenatum TaxID=906689 RepID=A0A2I0VDL8_9ASPA|nr:hypothetical protein MA16_Dca027355 [Dendrobium catenatum]